ncbi:MAG: asparagine synthase (glutamine-hydrolyzing) [Myxococcaceae bacterium]|nr:asparagine synthase (glutamine-hydrolyzing) [Myxococcaceae bacterium]
MCGIAGVVQLDTRSEPPSHEALARMAGALHHRGPDARGLYRDAHAGLAHTRLSIIDLKSGQQPLSNADGSLWLTFNGEIFNYVELRAELETLGHRFKTKSDTEVIVHAYEAWGDAAFERFNGQWAVGLWDTKKKKLVLSRDRLGVRPLYYAETPGRVAFASEVKALFAGDPKLDRTFDLEGLSETFTFWSIVPPQSVFKGVRELEPGHTRTYEDGKVIDRAYWQQSYGGFEGTLDEAVEATRAALLEATKLRMLRADVPVGSYLSGGLDSSLTAAMGREAKGEGFMTFSLRFADAEYDETQYQRQMSQALGTEHHEVLVSRGDIARSFAEVIRLTERPVLRTAPAPLWSLSKLVREQGLKVVLTGEGADEVFAGYDLFREGRVRRFWARRPDSKCRPLLLERLYPYLQRSPTAQRAMTRQFFGRGLEHYREPGFAHGPRWQSAQALQRLFVQRPQVDVIDRLVSSLPADFERWSPLQQDQYLEIRTLLSGYLLSSQGDRMLMGNSVEGRFPFLDSEVVKLAMSLPDAYKLRVLDEKHVLKRAARGRVPEEIIARQKQPYRAPDALAFTGPLPEALEAAMSPEALKACGVFDPAQAGRLWAKVRGGKPDAQFSNADNMALVGVLSTQLVHAQLIAAPQRVTPAKFETLHERA